jgi:5-methylcytosine-specific restriction endonuclease McrA
MATEKDTASVLSPLKCCNCCNNDLPRKLFARSRHRDDGLQPRCRACQKRMAARHYVRNLERRRAEIIAWREANLEKERVTGARYRLANRDKTRKRIVAWERANPAKVAARTVRCRQAHPERYRLRAARWRANHPDVVQAQQQRRRARRRNAPGRGVTNEQWAGIVAEHGRRCAYCGALSQLHMDHLDPLSRGGDHDVTNVLPACQRCNSSKYNKTLLLWMVTRRAVSKELRRSRAA